MKLKHTKPNSGIQSLAIHGKQHKVDEKGLVEIPNETPAKTVKHLLSQGWKVADSAAEAKSKEPVEQDGGKHGGKHGK